jgi:hypothetical protein
VLEFRFQPFLLGTGLCFQVGFLLFETGLEFRQAVVQNTSVRALVEGF